jgi:hypothetical protein
MPAAPVANISRLAGSGTSCTVGVPVPPTTPVFPAMEISTPKYAPGLPELRVEKSASVTALLSHLTKGGLRLAVNTSPEPVTNIGTSLAEDGAVVGVTLLAWQFPWVAAGIALTLLAIGMSLVYVLLSRVRRGLARLRARRSSPSG